MVRLIKKEKTKVIEQKQDRTIKIEIKNNKILQINYRFKNFNEMDKFLYKHNIIIGLRSKN